MLRPHFDNKVAPDCAAAVPTTIALRLTGCIWSSEELRAFCHNDGRPTTSPRVIVSRSNGTGTARPIGLSETALRGTGHPTQVVFALLQAQFVSTRIECHATSRGSPQKRLNSRKWSKDFRTPRSARRLRNDTGGVTLLVPIPSASMNAQAKDAVATPCLWFRVSCFPYASNTAKSKISARSQIIHRKLKTPWCGGDNQPAKLAVFMAWYTRFGSAFERVRTSEEIWSKISHFWGKIWDIQHPWHPKRPEKLSKSSHVECYFDVPMVAGERPFKEVGVHIYDHTRPISRQFGSGNSRTLNLNARSVQSGSGSTLQASQRTPTTLGCTGNENGEASDELCRRGKRREETLKEILFETTLVLYGCRCEPNYVRMSACILRRVRVRQHQNTRMFDYGVDMRYRNGQNPLLRSTENFEDGVAR
ncbi:hypothetical protein GGX14DRAFT_673560 [Mycena pura]|uniref:Uncharacterized protein n=1 Tax=Mycena pura TaxID=153505 RepID=A0AAD6UW34_9AGAR|nr:hypothetical protein GGX14DRAFT_673560 [Mycena pura]